MAFSIFNKKGTEPAKPGAVAKPGAAAIGVAKTSAPSRAAPPQPKPAALAPAGLSSKINEIEAAMEQLDFIDLSARPAAVRVQPPSDLPDTVISTFAPTVVTAAPVSAATPAPVKAMPQVAPVAKATPTAKATPPVKAAPAVGATPTVKVQPAPPAKLLALPKAAAADAPKPIAAVTAVPVASAAAALASPGTRADGSSAALTSLGVSSVMMRDLAFSPFEAAPVLEQAALLYAEGNHAETRAALEAALKAGRMPPAAAHQAWLLLFDLLETMGAVDQFEAAAIDFAVAFETSPPAFNNRSDANDPMLDTGGGQYYAINGALDAAIAPQLARLGEIAARSKVMRIEFGKIKSVAAPGCALLLERLRGFKKAGLDLVFSNIDHLAGLLSGVIETGRPGNPEVFWLLQLELLQFQGQQQVFEDLALNYCMTYEVSPPQWVAPAHLAMRRAAPPAAASAAASAAAGTTSGMPLPQDAYYLKGTLQGSADPRFAALNAYAASRPLVVIDMHDLRRVAPAAASEFINLLSALYVQNKELELRSPSPLIATLLISMGFTEQARFTLRAP